MGVRARTSKEGNGRMAQQGRIVGIDVAKLKADACIRSLQLRLSQPSTAQGQQDMITWLRRNEVGLAVMEASGGYERVWAEALRAAAIAVRIVDPKRVRYFAKSAGRLAKNDPIDAEMIAWFAETFAVAAEPAHDADRDALNRLVTARSLLVRLATPIRQLGEHGQPRVVENAQRAILKTIKAQLAKLEAAIEAKIAANAQFLARRAIIASVPGSAITSSPARSLGCRSLAASVIKPPPGWSVSRRTTTTAVSIEASAISRAGAETSAPCSIWRPSAPRPATIRLSWPITKGCALRAKRPKSRWSPACANWLSSSTRCSRGVRCGTRPLAPPPSHERP